MRYNFRPDGTSYHVAVYDAETGAYQYSCTHQGYADDSMWARGQAWGIYGYTMVYRFMPEVVRYGASKGVGVWVYVNQHALQKQGASLFPVYEKWGLKGVKFGFVQFTNQHWADWVHGLVRIKKYGKATVTVSTQSSEAAPAGYVSSATIEVNVPAGFYREHNENPDLWITKTNGATKELRISDAGERYLYIVPNKANANTGRGDFGHAGQTFISKEYPIITIRVDDVNDRMDEYGKGKFARNINLDTSGTAEDGTKYSPVPESPALRHAGLVQRQQLYPVRQPVLRLDPRFPGLHFRQLHERRL